MSSRDRIELAKIPALTLYKDADAVGRRTTLPQLVCKGKPCNLYQPEVVRCTKLPGGSGTNIDWKCEADLPESLRFGRTDVSCEGWSGPGDPYVVRGSCSLEYRLVEVPGALRGKGRVSRWSWDDLLSNFFTVIWVSILVYIIYKFIYSFLSNRNQQRGAQARSQPSSRPGGGGGGGGAYWGGGSGRFPGYYDDPPPPYTDNRKPNSSGEGWRPGFWTGAALGGLANHFFNRTAQPTTRPYDWERERSFQIPFISRPLRRAAPSRPVYDADDDRGEGSSNLGSVRRSTGYGGTNVR